MRATAAGVARAISRGAEAVVRPFVYAAAGLLTSEQLSALIARRWAEFGADRVYVLSGLEPWEADFYSRFLRPGDRVLVVGCGSGREVIALRRQGYLADGLEPAAPAVARARAMLRELGVGAEVHVGTMESVPPAGTWDACIFSWRCYSYIPERLRRVGALRAAGARLAPDGRLLLSYVRRETPPRRLPRAVSAAVARLSGSGRRPDVTDVIALESGGLHFEHQFVTGEVEAEARDARLRVLYSGGGAEQLAVLASADR